jgi:hypothetical protein
VAEPELRAVGFNAWVRELRQIAAPDRFADLVTALPAPTAALVDRPPAPDEWLSYSHPFALVHLAHERLFHGDERITSNVSRRIVGQDLRGLYRVFVRLTSPEFVIDRAARLWPTYWRNNGTVRVEPVNGEHVRVRFEGLSHATPLFWTLQCGLVRGVTEATRIASVSVRILDGRDSPSDCTFDVTWRR